MGKLTGFGADRGTKSSLFRSWWTLARRRGFLTGDWRHESMAKGLREVSLLLAAATLRMGCKGIGDGCSFLGCDDEEEDDDDDDDGFATGPATGTG